MTTREQAYAAKRLVGDETFTDAVKEIMDKVNKDLLSAKTPEEREQKFQEYSAIKRVQTNLKKLALETKKFERRS